MKILYTIAIVLIGTLTLAAFNPDDIVRIAHEAKFQYVEQPQEVERIRELMRDADDGDPYALFTIGSLHFNSKWHLSEVQETALGSRNPSRGEAMIQEAARLGHPEAMYWVWMLDGGNEQAFVRVLRAESHRAIGRVLSDATYSPCDEQTFKYLTIVADVIHDPGFPKNRYGSFTKSQLSEIRISLLRNFAETFGRVQEVRATGCSTP